jgi:hypothetical protein
LFLLAVVSVAASRISNADFYLLICSVEFHGCFQIGYIYNSNLKELSDDPGRRGRWDPTMRNVFGRGKEIDKRQKDKCELFTGHITLAVPSRRILMLH